MKRAKVLATARLAGQVTRYHTWPVHHRQTVGEHTWQVMRIYYQIFGPPSALVFTKLIWDDAGELVTGDLPFPIKARNPGLKAIMDSLEEQAVEGMGGNPRPGVSDVEKRRVKTCDLIDMLEYGLHELDLGNKYAQPIVDDIGNSLRQLWKWDADASNGDLIKITGYLLEHVENWSWK